MSTRSQLAERRPIRWLRASNEAIAKEWTETGAPLKNLAAKHGLSGERIRQILILVLGKDEVERIRQIHRNIHVAVRAARLTTCQCGAPKSEEALRCQQCFMDQRSAAKGQNRWSRVKVIAAVNAWARRFGRPPSAADWNPAFTESRGDHARAAVFREGGWPHLSTCQYYFGSWGAMLLAAGYEPNPSGFRGHGLPPRVQP